MTISTHRYLSSAKQQLFAAKSQKFFSFYFLLIMTCYFPTVSAQLVRSAAGANAASIQTAVDQFRSDLSGGTVADPGFPGRFGGVRREINWDGVPNTFAAPNNLPANFFNVNSPRGVVFSTPGTGFQVSANTAVGATEFSNIDPSYSSLFAAFSPERLFTALQSNVTDITFFAPGTTTPAPTRGFGAVFSDVDNPNTTRIDFFDGNNNLLNSFFVPAFSGQESFSFLGVSYANPIISRVRITSGNAALGPGAIESIPSRDLVVMDDFIFGEPATVWYRDRDNDGFGDPNSAMFASTQPGGFVSNNLDCNDYKVFYQDMDNDGWGSSVKVPCGMISRTGDCNDNDRRIHSPQTFYRDADGDSYGDANSSIQQCTNTPPAGFVRNRIDCNDADRGVYWPKTYYRDADGDGLGDPNTKINVCSSTPPAGYVSNARDTNDTPPTVFATGTATNNTGGTEQLQDTRSPFRFSLSAYPNPFAGQTRIQYSVPVEAQVNIRLFDVLGREVGLLFNGKRSPGTHYAEYNAATLSQGVYYCRMTATADGQEFIQTQKLVKTK